MMSELIDSTLHNIADKTQEAISRYHLGLYTKDEYEFAIARIHNSVHITELMDDAESKAILCDAIAKMKTAALSAT